MFTCPLCAKIKGKQPARSGPSSSTKIIQQWYMWGKLEDIKEWIH